MKYGDVDVHDPVTQIPAGTKPLLDVWMRKNPFQHGEGNWRGCILVCRTDTVAQSRVSFVERPAMVPLRWEGDRLLPDAERAERLAGI